PPSNNILAALIPHSTRTTLWPKRIISSQVQCTRFIASAISRTHLPRTEVWAFRYDGKNITRTHVAGLDFNTGSFSHSIRFGYLKTERNIVDGTRGSGLPLVNYPLDIQMGNTALLTGPSANAPSAILQSDHQAKYDGSKTLGSHIIRYGLDFNRIAAGGFVPFFSLAPSLSTNIGASEMNFAAT